MLNSSLLGQAHEVLCLSQIEIGTTDHEMRDPSSDGSRLPVIEAGKDLNDQGGARQSCNNEMKKPEPRNRIA